MLKFFIRLSPICFILLVISCAPAIKLRYYPAPEKYSKLSHKIYVSDFIDTRPQKEKSMSYLENLLGKDTFYPFADVSFRPTGSAVKEIRGMVAKRLSEIYTLVDNPDSADLILEGNLTHLSTYRKFSLLNRIVNITAISLLPITGAFLLFDEKIPDLYGQTIMFEIIPVIFASTFIAGSCSKMSFETKIALQLKLNDKNKQALCDKEFSNTSTIAINMLYGNIYDHSSKELSKILKNILDEMPDYFVKTTG